MMAKTSSFSFTNTVASLVTIPLVKLGLVSNYGVTADEPTYVDLSNVTAATDQAEKLTVRCKSIPTIDTNGVSILYPNPVKGGVQYVLSLTDVLRTTDDANGFIVDHPIVAYLTIRHDLSGDITDEHIETVLSRLLSSLYDDAGNCRLSKLRRKAIKPTSD
jgi:hypothetical protein